ncbi:MAG: hypothetical protein H7Z43_13875 [Clostridia bacterium]|nr:hypothetical protein [Deltaproteobacteria bacterium]
MAIVRDSVVEGAILAPAFGELGPSCFDWFPNARVTVALQGMMRSAREDGTIESIDPPPLKNVHAVSFSEHDDLRTLDVAAFLARTVPVTSSRLL